MLSILFLEIDTARRDYGGNFDYLRGVVRFYLDILVITNQQERLKRFHGSYINNFSSCTNFDMEISKLLKRIYLEIYFVINIIGDRGLCRLVMDKILYRESDIFDHMCSKVQSFENLKHIFKIMGMMHETFKEKFKIL